MVIELSQVLKLLGVVKSHQNNGKSKHGTFSLKRDTSLDTSEGIQDAYFDFNLPEFATFSFPRKQWNELKKHQKGRQFRRNEWQHIIINGIKETNPFCVLNFNY